MQRTYPAQIGLGGWQFTVVYTAQSIQVSSYINYSVGMEYLQNGVSRSSSTSTRLSVSGVFEDGLFGDS